MIWMTNYEDVRLPSFVNQELPASRFGCLPILFCSGGQRKAGERKKDYVASGNSTHPQRSFFALLESPQSQTLMYIGHVIPI